MKTWQERLTDNGLGTSEFERLAYFLGRTDALREVVAKLKDCGHWGDVDALEKLLLKDLAEQEKEG